MRGILAHAASNLSKDFSRHFMLIATAGDSTEYLYILI